MDEWKALVAAYAAHQRAANLAPRTIEGRTDLLLGLAKWCGKTPANVTLEDLLGRLGRGVAAASMQRERSDYMAFFTWARSMRLLPRNPAKRLPRVIVPRAKPRPLTVEQINAMLTTGSYRKTRTMILLAYYQGLRAFEIAKVRGEDVDVLGGTLRVVGKGRKERYLPLHDEIRALVPDYPRRGWWFPGQGRRAGTHMSRVSVSDRFRQALRRAGVEDARLTGHSLRHSFGSELVEAGVDIRIVQELMRHDSLASTQIYTAVSAKQMRVASAKLPKVEVPDRAGRGAAPRAVQDITRAARARNRGEVIELRRAS